MKTKSITEVEMSIREIYGLDYATSKLNLSEPKSRMPWIKDALIRIYF